MNARGAPDEQQRSNAEAPSPFLGSWRNVYVLVAVELLVTVILLYALTRWAS